MISDHYRFCRVSYWKRNEEGHLVSASEEDWDECVIGPVSTDSNYGEQRFGKWEGAHSSRIRALISLLHQAYECGRHAKPAEIQNMLGIKR